MRMFLRIICSLAHFKVAYVGPVAYSESYSYKHIQAYSYVWSNVAKFKEIILCIQWNNYFDSMNYLYIQWNNYLYIQQNIYLFNERIIYIFNKRIIYIYIYIYLYIHACSSTIPTATKLGRVVTCGWGTPPSKSYDLLIMWSHDKCKNLYLHFRNIYSHQTWQSSNLRSGDPIFKVMWTFEYVVIWEMKKTCIYTYTIPMATKLGRVVSYIGGIPSTTSRNLLISWSCEKWKTL